SPGPAPAASGAPVAGGAPPHAAPPPPPSPVPVVRGRQPESAVEIPQVVIDESAAAEIKKRVGEHLKKALKDKPEMPRLEQQQRAMAWIAEAVHERSVLLGESGARLPTEAEDEALKQRVFDLLFRAGRLQPYLDRHDVEDIYLNGPDETWLRLSSGKLVKVPPVAGSEEELLDLLRDLARNAADGKQERNLSHARPFLQTEMPEGSRLQAITGVTRQTMATIRRHRLTQQTLDDMVDLGMIDTCLRDFLRAAIRAEKNIMFAGEAAVGKTTLMRAALREYGPLERFAVIEDTPELHADSNGYHQQVVSMLARESNGERSPDGRELGEITMQDLIAPALRMSVSRLVVGEVRGPEIVAMMQALTSGQGGTMCTLHAKRVTGVFDRIAELYGQAPHRPSERLAYKQIRNGLDFVVYVSRIDESQIGGTVSRYVSHVLEVTGDSDSPEGYPATNMIFGPRPEDGEPRAVPLLQPACYAQLRRVGLPEHTFDHVGGTWTHRLPLVIGGAG
ncbi:CpaF family protein, partial [Streptomyces alkaliterrae]